MTFFTKTQLLALKHRGSQSMEALRHISVSKCGQHIWGVNNAGNVYYRNGRDGSWKKIPGGLKQITSCGGGMAIGVNRLNHVYYIMSPTSRFVKFPGNFAYVSCHLASFF